MAGAMSLVFGKWYLFLYSTVFINSTPILSSSAQLITA